MSLHSLTLLLVIGLSAFAADLVRAEDPKSPLDFEVANIKGNKVNLADYKGKVVLIVNVASKCGYTKQYEGLEAIYKKYKDQGLVVIGFPANEFGKQEPGTNEEIVEFCTKKFSVDFDLMGKSVVKGDGINPVYKFLTDKTTNPTHGGDIKWNFTKFLIGRSGQIVNRYEPNVEPNAAELTSVIEAELAKK